jgi:hypothetical protein
LPERDWLGRKGRSLPGAHRPRGVLLAAGPSVRACGEVVAHIADASATCLARMGVTVPDESSGRVLGEILLKRSAASEPLPAIRVDDREGPRDLARTEARLRALGYVD